MTRTSYLILRWFTLAGATFLLATGAIPFGIVLALVFVFLILKTPPRETGGAQEPYRAFRRATPEPETPAPIAPVPNSTIPGVAELYGRLPKR